MKVRLLILLIIMSLMGFSQSGRSSKKYVYISEVPKPEYPAVIKIDEIEFKDGKDSRNNLLDAKETAYVHYRVTNEGKGDAYQLLLNITQTIGSSGVRFEENTVLGDLRAGDYKIFSIPITANSTISSGEFELLLSISEFNGFDSESVRVKFKTQEFKAPKVEVLEGGLVSQQSGKLIQGSSGNLNILVQNIGQGLAKDVKVEFKLPNENVFPTGDYEFTFESMGVNSFKKISFGFFLNKRYLDAKLKIEVVVTEKLGKYGDRRIFTFELGQQIASNSVFSIDGNLAKDIEIKKQTMISDVDKNIPDNSKNYPHKIALIIGNENYSDSQYGLNPEIDVAFAKSDARIFKEYCIKTLGVSPGNIVYRENATAAQMTGAIAKVKKLTKVIGPKSEVIVYYAGHGLPKEITKEAFLMPVDVTGTNIDAGIKLSYLYEQLTEFKSEKVTVFLDACFTGGARGQGLVAARGVRIKPDNDFLRGNVVVFSASSDTESSLPWKEKNHGLFTYFLLKKLQESKGSISYNDLFNYINKNVGLKSIQVNSKNQTPKILISPEVADKWKKWRL